MTLFENISTPELIKLHELYPWYSALRRELVRRSAIDNTIDGVFSASRYDYHSPLLERDVMLSLSSEEIVDRFLQERDLRIVAQEGEPDNDVVTEADLDDEDDLVSEELAQVYINQGLNDEAIAIYRRLSLQNPEKSVYFAEIIEQLETKN